MNNYYKMSPLEIDEDKKKRDLIVDKLSDSLLSTPNYDFKPTAETRAHDAYVAKTLPMPQKQEKPLPAFNFDEYESRNTYQPTYNYKLPTPYKSDDTSYNIAKSAIDNKDKDFWQGVRDKETEIGEKFKNSSLGKAWDSATNSGIGKFISRVGDTGANMVTGGSAKLTPTDTGSKVGNFLADLVGGGSGMFLNPGQNISYNQALRPIGSLAEKGTSKLTQNAPNVVKNLLPTMAREGVEQGIQEGMNANLNGADTKETLQAGLKGLGQGALFSGALKGANDYLLPNIVKTKTYEGSYAPNEPTSVVKETPNIITPKKKMPVIEPLNVKQEVAATNGNILKDMASLDLEKRSFKDTVKNADVTAPELKAKLENTEMNYNIKHNADVLKYANDFVDKNYDEAIKIAKDINSDFTAESSAVAQVLIKKAQDEGRWQDAIDIVESTAKKGTNAGQAIQALSMWGRLTPEGMLKYTQNVIDKVNKELPGTKKIKLPEELAEKISTKMKDISKMTDGREKTVEIAKVLADIDEVIPKSLARKISTVQAMSHLLNPKTVGRNIIGNGIFGGLENVSNVIGTPVDAVISKMTGKRTTMLPSLSTQFKAGKQGFVEAVEDALQGIDTTGTSGKIELGTGRTFKRNSLLGKLETGMNIGLQAPDEAFKAAAREESLRQQMKIAGVDKPTDGMIKIADELAKYRTFQDKNGISDGFQKFKDGLNNVSGYFTKTNEFGLGDLVLKYAKTPANILGRSLDYSFGGLAKTLREGLGPLVGKQFNQKEFVDALSRTTVGTGLIATGYGLSKLGIITGKGDKDIDVDRMNRQIGKSEYSINFNALKRYLKTGNVEDAKPQNGDKFTTWDWSAPVSIIVGMGANAGQNGNEADLITMVADASAAGINTIFEQPLLTGLKSVTQFGNIPEGLKRTAAGIPASFTPTLFKQFAQLGDNTARSNYDPSLGQQSINQVKQKLPMLSKTLEPQVNTFGEDRQNFESNGIKKAYDILLNPSFTNTYKPTQTTDMVNKIYEDTGSKLPFPKVAEKSFKNKGETIQLTPTEYTNFQRYIGTETQKKYQELSNDKNFMEGLSSEEKAKKLQKILNEVYNQGKKNILEGRGIK